MADIKSPTERYKEIADAIREKNGTTELMHPADMPQAILDIVSGGGRIYRDIVYNEDDTIDLIEKDGTMHKLECEYVDGMVSQIKFDDKKVRVEYDGQVLVKLGVTNISTTRAPTDVKIDDSGVVSFSGSVNEQGILSL
jgi:hypothetical protein